MSVTSNSRRSSRSLFTVVASLLVLAAAVLLVLNRQYVSDQISVWTYTPSSTVQSIDRLVNFTDKGTFYFYTTHPEVATASQFNKGCPRQEPSNPILGCYTGSRIYIYDVTNPQLNGIEEVTAAHEMLHAAWDRVDQSEKDRLTRLLQTEYQKQGSGELAERMAYYERTEPGQVINELHSILPTEVATLSPELEMYYAQYFQDRQKVVTLHKQYNTVLIDLKSQADALYATLTAQAEAIERSSAEYSKQAAELSATIDTFNRRAENNDFSSQQQFSAQRAELVARSNQLTASREAINASINLYNQTYAQYQVVAGELDTLNESLDSITTLPDSPIVE